MKHFCIYRSYTQVQRHILMGFAVTLLIMFTSLSQTANAKSTKTPWQNLTPSQLTAVWWQWAFSVPKTNSPLYEDIGSDAYNGQPYSNLLFLAGTFSVAELQNGDTLGKVTRSISVKQGIAFFFPLINGEQDNVCLRTNLGGNCFGLNKFPSNLGVPKLQAKVAEVVNATTGLFARMTPTDETFNQPTGQIQNIIYPRLQSPPFSFRLPATNNLYQFQGVDVSGTVAPAVADGYYSFVPGTLEPGYYKLEFGGGFPNNRRAGEFSYF
jgi:hypothetical protein